MAEPIGITSGLVALATFAFQSSLSLYQAIANFQSNKRIVRELKEELEALEAVLRSLQAATTDNTVDLPALKLPLLRCGQACREFEALIAKCTTHSDGSKTSIRDWAKLTYMGDDIVGFKNMLAGYKATICIALGDANFRKVKVTADVLKEYKEMISNTTADLEEHLQEIERKLEALPLRADTMSDEEAAERDRMRIERESTKQCLVICQQVSEQVNQLRPNVFEDLTATKGSHQVDVTSGHVSAKLVTASALQELQEKLTNTTSTLEQHLQDIDNKLRSLPSPAARILGGAERDQVQAHKESIEQCLAICTQADQQADQFRTNVFEDVLAAREAHQLIVSTLGDLISAKRVTAELASTQWLGQMSDLTVQQLSKDQVSRSRAVTDKAQSESGVNFADQYGRGRRLS